MTRIYGSIRSFTIMSSSINATRWLQRKENKDRLELMDGRALMGKAASLVRSVGSDLADLMETTANSSTDEAVRRSRLEQVAKLTARMNQGALDLAMKNIAESGNGKIKMTTSEVVGCIAKARKPKNDDDWEYADSNQ